MPMAHAHLRSVNMQQSFSSTNYQREVCIKNGIYETISFGKSEKVPLRILVLKAEFYLKFQVSNH
jgi:hypothetical protein